MLHTNNEFNAIGDDLLAVVIESLPAAEQRNFIHVCKRFASIATMPSVRNSILNTQRMEAEENKQRKQRRKKEVISKRIKKNLQSIGISNVDSSLNKSVLKDAVTTRQFSTEQEELYDGIVLDVAELQQTQALSTQEMEDMTSQLALRRKHIHQIIISKIWKQIFFSTLLSCSGVMVAGASIFSNTNEPQYIDEQIIEGCISLPCPQDVFIHCEMENATKIFGKELAFNFPVGLAMFVGSLIKMVETYGAGMIEEKLLFDIKKHSLNESKKLVWLSKAMRYRDIVVAIMGMTLLAFLLEAIYSSKSVFNTGIAACRSNYISAITTDNSKLAMDDFSYCLRDAIVDSESAYYYSSGTAVAFTYVLLPISQFLYTQSKRAALTCSARLFHRASELDEQSSLLANDRNAVNVAAP